MSSTPGPAPHQTTLLIPNLHCPSCVSNIEGALYSLHPKPLSISHSIVAHTVTVSHLPSLPLALVCIALEDAGYDIDSVHADSRSNDPYSSELSLTPRLNISRSSSSWSISSRGRHTDQEERSRKRKRHIENCEACRESEHKAVDGVFSGEEKASLIESERRSSDYVHEKEDVIIRVEESSTHSENDKTLLQVAKPAPLLKSFEAEFSIGGMTCSACSNNITNTLQGLSWIQSVSINLITRSGNVTFSGDHKAEEIVETIEDLGYDAALQHVNEASPQKGNTKLTENSWKASYAIGGMTCSSCSNAIAHALQSLPWIREVEVNLISNSATIVFEGKDHLDTIRDTIEDIGYDAKLDEVVHLAREAMKNNQRKVAIQINGMYCGHCPQRIETALKKFESQICIEKLPTTARPILNLSYTPHPPMLTIRKLLSTISVADPAFEPSIYHPTTIEERSRLMLVREQLNLQARLALTITVAIPTFIIGIVYMDLVSSSNPGRMYFMQPLKGISRAEWALFIMATPVYFFAADIFHKRTIKELRALWRRGSPVPLIRRFVRFGSMNMLVSMGTTIAYFSSIAILIVSAIQQQKDMNNTKDFYFDSVVFLTMFLLIGRWMEAYSKSKAGDAVAMLGKLRPTDALLVETSSDNGEFATDTTVSKISVDLLEYGDIIKVQQGNSPPCDGTVVEGGSTFDESSLTGEARPIRKSIGDQVFAGTINQGGAVSLCVTGVAGSSMLDQIMKVVREGQTRRAPVERIADVLTGHFVPVVTLIAVLTWVLWLSLGLSGILPHSYLDTNIGSWPYWSLQFAIAVFVVACPCGIGLAAPTALFVGGGLAAKHGILVKGGGEAFQEASNLDCIVFDKTGTLTMGGKPIVTDREVYTTLSDDVIPTENLFGMMQRLEEDSGHPMAKAVVAFCSSRSTSGANLKDTSEIAGRGMRGSFIDSVDASRITEMLIGNEALMDDHNVAISESIAATLDSWKAAAKSVVLVAVKQSTSSILQARFQLVAALAVSDPIRPEAPSVIAALQSRRVAVWMISGDNPRTAHAVGAQIGIPADNIIAGVLPAHKAEKIKYLQKTLPSRQKGRRAVVAMVGDGINDSPALATADIGIAIGSGSDVAISAAAFVLVTSRLTSLLTLLDLSRAVFRRIKFNFAWALVYNMVGLPVAAGVLYPIVSGGRHVRLDPVWAALAMALSSVSVVSSSLLLRTRIWGVGFRAAKSGQVE